MFEMKQLSALDVLKILYFPNLLQLELFSSMDEEILRHYYLKYMLHVLENLNFENSFYPGHWFNGKLVFRKSQSSFVGKKVWMIYIISHISSLIPLSKVCQISQTRTFPYKDRIVDSVLIRENAGQRKPVFGMFYAMYLLLKHWFFTKINAWPQNNRKKSLWNFWILFFSFSKVTK